MKYKILVPLLLLTLSCNFITGGVPGSASTAIPSIDFNLPGNPINVNVQLDEANSRSGMFSPNGGTMSLTTPDGTMYTLEVPPGALNTDTAITMTVVKSMDGAPLNGDVFAVQLEPLGLVFNEIVTLTIQPAQEIPVKEQIIFGYESSGKDYHLAIVDPKSREIKIKLMGFSGAGVGRGGDAEWAATLKGMAENGRTRFVNEFGRVTQIERQRQLTGETTDDTPTDLSKTIQSLLDQFYDQVVLKEIAAAELDCRYARKALNDLLFIERHRQLMGFSNDQKSSTVDISGKVDRLKKIASECKQGYTASGSAEDITISGTICGTLDAPFTLSGKIQGGAANLDFFPSSEKGGNMKYSASAFGFTATGGGPYTIVGPEEGPLTLKLSADGCVDGVGPSCKMNTLVITLTPTESCGQ